jgi:hypothetical protein
MDCERESRKSLVLEFNTVLVTGQIDKLKLLIDSNLDLIRSREHWFLHAVSHKRDDRMAILLLDAGAPVDHLPQEVFMDLVTWSRSVAVLTRLLARGVDVRSLRDSIGNSICHKLIWNAKRDDVSVLLRALVELADANVNAVDDVGMAPLHFAAMLRNLSAMHVLVELGADVGQRQFNGRAALHWLCGNNNADGDTACIELLLALGADMSLFSFGQTACHSAASEVPADGATPREIAARNGCLLPTDDEIDAACKRIAKTRLDLVRRRAMWICIGLQPLDLDALQLCEILMFSFGALASLIAFHQWWKIATTVKHFSRK